MKRKETDIEKLREKNRKLANNFVVPVGTTFAGCLLLSVYAGYIPILSSISNYLQKEINPIAFGIIVLISIYIAQKLCMPYMVDYFVEKKSQSDLELNKEFNKLIDKEDE